MKNLLAKQYPELFTITPFRLDIEPGWEFLVEAICKHVTQVNSSKEFKFHFVQVKEKFGEMRVYYDLSFVEPSTLEVEGKTRIINQVRGFVSAMENISGGICEITGNKGRKRQSKGWVKTLCDEEALKQNYID